MILNLTKDTIPANAVYVGRPTIYGNPYSHIEAKNTIRVSSRKEAIDKFRIYLMNNASLLEQVKINLHGKPLACWCSPKPCHAEVLYEITNSNSLF